MNIGFILEIPLMLMCQNVLDAWWPQCLQHAGNELHSCARYHRTCHMWVGCKSWSDIIETIVLFRHHKSNSFVASFTPDMLSDAKVMLHSHSSSIPPGGIRHMDVKSTIIHIVLFTIEHEQGKALSSPPVIWEMCCLSGKHRIYQSWWSMFPPVRHLRRGGMGDLNWRWVACSSPFSEAH